MLLNSLGIAIVAAVLLVAGLVFMPLERRRGAAAAAIGFLAAACIVVILRLMR